MSNTSSTEPWMWATSWPSPSAPIPIAKSGAWSSEWPKETHARSKAQDGKSKRGDSHTQDAQVGSLQARFADLSFVPKHEANAWATQQHHTNTKGKKKKASAPTPTTSPVKGAQEAGEKHDKHDDVELNKQNLYKTELCRSYTETGTCRYGHKCQFAHGGHELRPVVRHPKYKTEVCKKFATCGQCPYGTRCRFIHPTPPALSPPAIAPIASMHADTVWANSWAAAEALASEEEQTTSHRLAVFQNISPE